MQTLENDSREGECRGSTWEILVAAWHVLYLIGTGASFKSGINKPDNRFASASNVTSSQVCVHVQLSGDASTDAETLEALE